MITSEGNGLGSHILVIDDEEAVLEAVHDVLEMEGFDVRSASHGQVLFALQAPGAELPALVLLDVFLRDGNGIELAKRLRAHERTRNIPIILMSAQFQGTIPRDVANAFLAKPFDIAHLLELVEEHLLPRPFGLGHIASA